MDERDGSVVVTPSELRTFIYCPRLYFFERHLGRERGLRERLRLLLGRLFHALKGSLDRLRGYRVEEPFEAELGGVVLRGRPDSYRLDGDVLVVVERKSGRAPRRGVWESDLVQAAAYALGLRASGRASWSNARLVLEYRDARREVELGSEVVALLLRAIDDLILVKEYGIVPAARRSRGRCSRCPFRLLCEELDRALPLPEPGEEPGSWTVGLGNNLQAGRGVWGLQGCA